MNHEHQSGNGGWLGSRRSLVLLVFLAIIGFFPRVKETGSTISSELKGELS